MMVHDTVQRLFRPGCFFVAPPRTLRLEHVADETVRWEIFRGHLLDPAQTAASESFAAWHVFFDSDRSPAAAPLVSIRWQRQRNEVFVTRQILSYGFEAYEDAPGVILTRPVEKWVAELVGTIESELIERGALADELGALVFLAVVGISRLPITSLESPLPAFSLGQLAYLPDLPARDQTWSDPLEFLAAALAGQPSAIEEAKTLEAVLRAGELAQTPELADLLQRSMARSDRGAAWLGALFRAVFHGVALSPYTHFADAMIALVLELARAECFGPAAALDVLGYMLRHLCRHLTAFDLTLFHNFGANYPDALFLDALLTASVQLLTRHPDLMGQSTATGRRRALRQACLVRKQYEGHRVPDAPTSMGENARVLPEPFVRVPDEQIFEASKRRRQLFTDQTTETLLGDIGRRALDAGIADLDDPAELRELGMAQFLDRPLGMLKAPGEVDRTPLVSYEAFSRSIARRRVGQLHSAGWIDEQYRDDLLAAVNDLSPPGVPVSQLAPTERPGVVSVADAAKAASDFVLLRSTRGSLGELLSHYDLRPLGEASAETRDWLVQGRHVLVVQHVLPDESARPVLRVFSGETMRLELGFPPARSTMAIYRQRGGVEFITRLQVLKLCDSDGRLYDTGEKAIWMNLRADS